MILRKSEDKNRRLRDLWARLERGIKLTAEQFKSGSRCEYHDTDRIYQCAVGECDMFDKNLFCKRVEKIYKLEKEILNWTKEHSSEP